MSGEDEQTCRSPEDAIQLVQQARDALSEPYTKAIQVGVWALIALENYDRTGMTSPKQPLLHVVDTRVTEFEERWHAVHASLETLLDAVVVVAQRGSSI